MSANLEELDEQDKRCAHRDEQGKRCGGYHTKTSAFCNVHSGGIEKMMEARRKNEQQIKELKESLDFDIEKLETVEDVKVALQRLFNAVKVGIMNKERANVLIAILQQMQRVLEKNSGNRTNNFVNIHVDSGAKLMAAFANQRELDDFLLAGETATVKMLEDMHRQGTVTVAEPGDPEPEPEPEATEEPVLDLFSLPQYHQWKGKYEVVSADIAEMWYTCELCGKRSITRKKEECNG